MAYRMYQPNVWYWPTDPTDQLIDVVLVFQRDVRISVPVTVRASTTYLRYTVYVEVRFGDRKVQSMAAAVRLTGCCVDDLLCGLSVLLAAGTVLRRIMLAETDTTIGSSRFFFFISLDKDLRTFSCFTFEIRNRH